jgi:hypothetical protein
MYLNHPLLKALHPEGHNITSLREDNIISSELRVYDKNLDERNRIKVQGDILSYCVSD